VAWWFRCDAIHPGWRDRRAGRSDASSSLLVSNRVAGSFRWARPENPLHRPDDKRKMVAATIAANRRRAMVYAGIAGNCFRESVDAAITYKEMGADCVVAHMPSYYPITTPRSKIISSSLPIVSRCRWCSTTFL